MDDVKATLIAVLARLNQDVLSKLEGLGEYDLRRPVTPTGTNLLGVVKHLASVQSEYFGLVLGRPLDEPMPWFADDAEINDDMFATADESSEWVMDFYRRTWIHANESFAETDLDDTGTVPWWPEDRRNPTLAALLAHMIMETSRHAGHIDVARELIDGETGRFAGDASMPGPDEIDWPAYVSKVEAAAKAASQP